MSQYAKKNTNPTKTVDKVGEQTVKRKAARHVSGKHGRISLVIFYSRSSSFKLLYYYSFVFFSRPRDQHSRLSCRRKPELLQRIVILF